MFACCGVLFVVVEGHWVSGDVEIEAGGYPGPLKPLFMPLEIRKIQTEARIPARREVNIDFLFWGVLL